MLVAVDPGKLVAGVALFDDKELAAAWLVEGNHHFDTAERILDSVLDRVPRPLITRVVIEKMQIYLGERVNKNDLIDVAIMTGATGEAFRLRLMNPLVIELPHPRKWKGQVPKDVMVKRVIKTLSGEEHQRVRVPSQKKLAHNVWDAVGIGLWASGRLK